MLEDLRLGMNPVPRHPQGVGEKALEQAVVPDDLQREAAAVGGQPHAPVGQPRYQPKLIELLQHGRHRPRRYAKPLGERIRGNRLVAARFQREDRL